MGATTLQQELARAAQGIGDGRFQQGQTALHHGHPVAGHLHHGSTLIQPHQLGLLGEQHAGGGQLQARQDLLPKLGKVWRPSGRCGLGYRGWLGRWVWLERGLGQGRWLGGRSGLDRRWGYRCRGYWCWGYRRWAQCSGFGRGENHRFGQQAQQQHLQPEAWVDAVAQLLLAALELGLPLQQPGLADAPGQLGKFAAKLG